MDEDIQEGTSVDETSSIDIEVLNQLLSQYL